MVTQRRDIAIIFDLDDTLYLRKDQFMKATHDVFIDLSAKESEDLYPLFQKYSDSNFERHQQELISFEQMRINRITEACEALNYKIVKDDARKWQERYLYYQNHITLSSTMIDILNSCHRNNIELGIISNGESHHQRLKINALMLSQWFDEDKIVISGDIGITKPDERIFAKLEKYLEAKTIYYIGDSYYNDIEGAHKYGFKSIWLNLNGIDMQHSVADYEVSSHQQLKLIIDDIINK